MPSLTSTLLLAVVMAPPHGAPPNGAPQRFGQREAAVDLRSPAGVDAAAGELLQQQGRLQQRGQADQAPSYNIQPPSQERRPGVSVGAPVAPSRNAVRSQSNAGGAVPAKPSDPFPPRSKNAGGKLQAPTPTRSSAFTTVAASLGVVLGLFFLVVWFARRSGRVLQSQMPAEVLEVLGRSPLSTRMQMHVVRFGNKLVLLAVSAEGAVSLSEITEPLEVDRLAGACKANRNNSITDSFRQVLGRMGEEPAPKGFLGAEASRPSVTVAGENA